MFFSTSLTSSLALAGDYVPGALWESPLISQTVLSVARGDVDGDGRDNLLVLTPKTLTLHADLSLSGSLLEWPAQGHREFHRVWVTQADGVGALEIVVAGYNKEQVFTAIYKWQSGQLELWQEWLGKLVVPLDFRKTAAGSFPGVGGVAFLSQNQKGRGEWAGEIKKMTWRDGSFKDEVHHVFKKGWGSQNISLWDIAVLDQKMVISRPDGALEVWEAGRFVWKSGIKYGGAVDIQTHQSKDPLGILREEQLVIPVRLVWRDVFDKIMPSPKPILDLPRKSRQDKTPVMAPEPVFVPRGEELIVVRNDGFLENVIGRFPRMKSAELVQLKWSGKIFQEKFVSPKMDGAIADVLVMDFDGDGLENEALIVLWTRQGRVLGQVQSKGSVLAVVKLN